MKIVALYGVLQEKLNLNFLKISIKSLYNSVDEVIVLFDTPNDIKKLKKELFLKKKKISIYLSRRKVKKTNSPVSELLRIGRSRKGTHFIFLDADEALTYKLNKNLRKFLKKMNKGDKMFFHWMTMWKDHQYIRIDKKSLWSNLYKDFVYCDNLKDKFTEYYHDYGRTPGDNAVRKQIKIFSNQGAIMHFQYANWSNYQYKQAWNMCHTLTLKKNEISTNISQSANKINRMYFYTYFENFPKLRKIDRLELKHIPKKYFNNININNSEFWHKRFNSFFNKNKIENFEQLNIWHIPFLKKLFFNKTNRFPQKNLKNKIIFCLFIMLETIRNLLRIMKI